MKLSHAMILAAGLGTRMRPLTHEIPKPLIQVGGKPLIDWCLDWLSAAGISQVVINTSYRAQQLEDYLAARKARHISISREGEPPLETGGGVVKALPLLGDGPFLTMNSDAIFIPPPAGGRLGGGHYVALPHPDNVPLPTSPLQGEECLHPIAQLEAAWDASLDFLMLVVPKAQALGWEGQGDFVVDADGRVRRPQAGEDAPYVFSGVEIMHPRVFEGCPAGAFSLSLLWKQRAEADGWYRNIRAVVFDGTWLNVGDLPGLKVAEEYLAPLGI